MKAVRMLLMAGLLLISTGGLWADSTDTLYCNVAGSSCLTFDGSNDYVNLGTNSSLQLSGNLTVMGWAKLGESNSGKLMGIAGKLVYRNGFCLVRNSSNQFSFWMGDGSYQWTLISDETYTDTEWHHIAGVLDSGVAYLYVDGNLEASGGASLSTVDSGQKATIGRLYGDYSGYAFLGSIDDVRFYDRGLESTDVALSMLSLPSSTDTGLKGYWNFDQGNGQVASDSSLYGNDGTLGASSSSDSYDPDWTDISDQCETERTYYVNADTGSNSNSGLTSATAFATIQYAIDMCSDGDTVVVADGLYAGSGNVALDFEGKAITVMSANGADAAIIDCASSAQGVYFHSGETEESILDGFTIMNGQAYYGGGIYCLASTPLIRNCVISDCTATYGGGFSARQTGSVQVTGCSIVNNSAIHGGGIYLYTSTTQLLNCVVAENTASSNGGGLRCEGNNYQPSLTHCTVVNNYAGAYGGGILINYNRVTIDNSIFWDNAAAQSSGIEMTIESSGRATVNYTDVTGGSSNILTRSSGQLTWGTGNLDEDPLMPYAEDGDYHLASERGRYWPEHEVWIADDESSPCIDAGDPSDDASEEASPNGSCVNMGAYGGTAYASRTLTAEGEIFSDRDADGLIDIDDLFLLIDEWLYQYQQSL